jgi:hypothetical protein
LDLHELVVDPVVNKSRVTRMVTNTGEQIIHHRQPTTVLSSVCRLGSKVSGHPCRFWGAELRSPAGRHARRYGWP